MTCVSNECKCCTEDKMDKQSAVSETTEPSYQAQAKPKSRTTNVEATSKGTVNNLNDPFAPSLSPNRFP